LNLQTIPRKDKVVKEAFIPKLDALLYFDYDQIELRLLAFYMAVLGDPSMADAIKAGKDLHTESAAGALGISGTLTDEQRQVGKVLNFSLVYGGGTPTIMRQLEVGFPAARKMLDRFHQRWPGIRIVQAALSARLSEKGCITTLFGRELHPESEHKQLNALVQGCAADLMRNSLVTVDDRLIAMEFESHLINVVHDEVQLDAREGEIETLVREVPLWMDYAEVSSVVPIGVACEISRTTWADKEGYIARR
jgi:DNA polymerase-1